MVFGRLIQRTLEICIAFYKDVLSPNLKSSALNNISRIKLAVHSILEITILSTILYTLLNFKKEFKSYLSTTHINYFKYIVELTDNIIINWFHSLAVSFFNFSFDGQGFGSIVHLLQLINSIVLITLSIANYLGMKNENYFYKIVFDADQVILNYCLFINDEENFCKHILSAPNLSELATETRRLWENNEISDDKLRIILNKISETEKELEIYFKMNIIELDQFVKRILIETRLNKKTSL